MYKYIIALLLLNFSVVFANNQEDHSMPPQRQDRLDCTSNYALKELQRPQYLLSTLVANPQNYQMMLSDNPHFGAEAVPAYIFSDKPTVIIYKGSLTPEVQDQELAFVIAHELGHIHHQHMQNFDQRMEGIMTGPPAGISGTTFNIFAQKFEERQADLFGQNLYQKAGYNMNFFQENYNYIQMNHGYDRHMSRERPMLTSLSMKDSHFSMLDRFQLLASKAHTA